jgi:hypothetical protein
MLGEMLVHVRKTLGYLLHHKDPSTGRIGFEVQEPIRRAGLFTQAAARAAIQILQRRSLRADVPAGGSH